ncbi:hypothetical protein AVEN_212645-1 [Araneus ventricosus]|uniref:Mos1 transposase HTH domain-containing protein n=1 Tax=Araneus ventricosus TaxID=182803 RepID=A0A4Y2MCB3_ARAVE|nr:hypothetical protein AVEN_212645-1 [Araneus ventricosus]
MSGASTSRSCAIFTEWGLNLTFHLTQVRIITSFLGFARVISVKKVLFNVEQRVGIKFLVGENVPSSEIHQNFQQQLGKDLLSGTLIFQWCIRFREGYLFLKLTADLLGMWFGDNGTVI